jgi:hypothetical protein
MTEALSWRFEEFCLTQKLFIVLWSTLALKETDMKKDHKKQQQKPYRQKIRRL